MQILLQKMEQVVVAAGKNLKGKAATHMGDPLVKKASRVKNRTQFLHLVKAVERHDPKAAVELTKLWA